MSVGSFAQSELNTEVTAIVSGKFTAANFLTVANRAIRAVNSDLDLRSAIRSVALSPNLFDDIFQYTLPSDIKGNKIIDLKPQVTRGRFDRWDLVTQEEFDRKKQDLRIDRYGDPIELKGTQWLGDNLLAIQRDDLVNKLLISRPLDTTETGIDTLDTADDWEGFGDGTNLTTDTGNYIKDSGSINWDINADGGLTAGIVRDDLDTFDISAYVANGSIFVWAYASDVADLTNYIILVGSSSSAYHKITVTKNSEGGSFVVGWNLLRFDFVNKSETGTVDEDGCDYVALYMTKDAGKTSETDYRFDNIVMMLGDHYNVIYYSRYGWQSSAAVYLEDATTTTDLINCETDEFQLFILKTAQYMEQHLKNQGEAKIYETQYKEEKDKYVFENISQALPLNQSYYEL